MKYRQWKKNYKKRHGVNPPASIDKRKQRKAAKRALKHLADTITYTDFSGAISRAANALTDALTDAVASIMRAMGSACDGAGTVFKNVADGIQPLEIKGNVLSWEVKPVVCDYGVYENNALDDSSELKLITNALPLSLISQQESCRENSGNFTARPFRTHEA